MTTLNPAVARVLKRLHYPLDVILLCVRWYVAYPLSLRHLEEMMAERGISVDHSTVHHWAIKLLPPAARPLGVEGLERRQIRATLSYRFCSASRTYCDRAGGKAEHVNDRAC